MTLPAGAVAAIEHWCEDQTPPDMRDQMRLESRVSGDIVTLAECRPPWDGGPGEWTRVEFAQLRYDERTGRWALYWGDSNDRWHRYDDLEPTQELGEILAEIEDDPYSIFFG